jgi:two-component system response regulator PilR (NtrC family)
MASSDHVLVVDDEPGLRDVLEITLRRQGYRVTCCANTTSALEQLEQAAEPFPLVITDLVMPDGSGIDVLSAARSRSDQTQVIIVTAFSTVEAAIDAMRHGAYDFVTKPFSPAEIAELANKALEKSNIVAENKRLKAHLASMRPTADDDFGSAPVMRRVAALVSKAAAIRSTVLITGASGTGKERVARALHKLSDRKDGPFCVINCGALPENLMESELFGHEKGAFTGAASATKGIFRQASGGTLLLDEIGELPVSLQVKLLRVLQEKTVRPVGGSREEEVDVRLLAATNRDVEAAVSDGSFRQDLYYRLNVIRIELPPLRERDGEVRRLAVRFLDRFAAEMDRDPMRITPEAMRALEVYDYPGNIRELENTIERAVALASGNDIGLGDLPETVGGFATPGLPAVTALPEKGCRLDDVLEIAERHLLSQALERTAGNRTHAAKLLGISFRSLRYRLAKHGFADDNPAAMRDD